LTVLFKGDVDKVTGKHGSITTVISVWNGMVGSGLMTIPWAFSESGLILGIILSALGFTISFTTQYFCFKAAGDDLDFTFTMEKHFGRRGWKVGMFVFIGFFFVPVIVFMQLLSQMLFPVLLAFRFFLTGSGSTSMANLELNFGEFSYSWTVLMIFTLLMALGTMKDLSLFVKLNTYGAVFTVIVILFICSVGINALIYPNGEIGGLIPS
jgi:sodium-coupled neutral amino acid transporter 9